MKVSSIPSLLCTALAALLTTVAGAETLVIKGSNTLGTTLIPAWIEAFQPHDSNLSIDLSARGSNTGFDALLRLGIDIASSSRRARGEEFTAAHARGVVLHPTLVCYDGISVIVHESNPLQDLNPTQVQQIFTGTVNDWSELDGTAGTINRYIRNTHSGTYDDFQTLMLNRRRYAASCRNLSDSQSIVERVANDPRGIGYVGLAFTRAPGIKVLRIDGVMPSAATVHDGSYPVSRPNFFYTDGAPSGDTQRFIDFVLSDAGQQIVESVGFVPLKPIP